MQCSQCKHQLEQGAKRCPICLHVEGWNKPCPRCHNLIHDEATFCIHCKNDIGPDVSTFFDRLARKITLPIATLTSFVALVIPSIGLIKTAETALDSTPVLTVFPNSSTDKHLSLMIYNAGDRIAHIEKAAMVVIVYRSTAPGVARRTISEKHLKLRDKKNAILNPQENEVILEPVESSWTDLELNKWTTPKLLNYFANNYCYLSLVIRDTKSSDQIKPDETVLKGEECSRFVAYRYYRETKVDQNELASN